MAFWFALQGPFAQPAFLILRRTTCPEMAPPTSITHQEDACRQAGLRGAAFPQLLSSPPRWPAYVKFTNLTNTGAKAKRSGK